MNWRKTISGQSPIFNLKKETSLETVQFENCAVLLRFSQRIVCTYAGPLKQPAVRMRLN